MDTDAAGILLPLVVNAFFFANGANKSGGKNKLKSVTEIHLNTLSGASMNQHLLLCFFGVGDEGVFGRESV